MSKISAALLGCISLLAEANAAEAEPPPKALIYINGSANDFLARQFVFHIKELIRASNSMALAVSEDDARYSVSIVALDTACSGIAYSAVWTWRIRDKHISVFHDQVAGTCGPDGLQSCARSILARTDEQLEQDAKMWADAAKALKNNNTP